jgi:hypothetical protein
MVAVRLLALYGGGGIADSRLIAAKNLESQAIIVCRREA